MYVKHYKSILLIVSMSMCILFISQYTSNLDKWTRASTLKQPLYAVDVRQPTGKELDLDEFQRGKKNKIDVEEHQGEKKNKFDVDQLQRDKKSKLDVSQRQREKKNKPDSQELQRKKSIKLDVEEFLRETNNKLDGQDLRRDKINGERKKVELLQGKKDTIDIKAHLPRRKGFYLRSIRKKLNQTLINIEENVFTMNVKQILKSMPIVPLDENRLVHKIQRAQRHPAKYKCVIRIAKYCATRCDHYITRGHIGDDYHFHLEWKMFRCDFAQPCQVETRFVGDLTSEIMDTSDVIFFMSTLHEGLHLMRFIRVRPPGQLWTLYSRESPYHDPEYAPWNLKGNPFNLSITYARDTDIYFPYCIFKRKKIHHPPLPKKTKLIAWMASNCNRLSWRRGELVKELQKHLAVDDYGECGSLGPLLDPQQVLPEYKFYLAFENSECRDYISEKVWRTSLLQGIVPIVYGAKREDYEQTLPNNSFIYIEDFSNMSAFVDYILELDSNDALYEKYFDWREVGHVTCIQDRKFALLCPESNMWYLLKKLINLHIHPNTSWRMKTPNFASWWQEQCPDLDIEKNVLGLNVHQKASP